METLLLPVMIMVVVTRRLFFLASLMLFVLGSLPGLDMPADAPATRSGSLERGAAHGVAAESAGTGSRRAQIALRERGALLLCANGGCER